MGPITTEEVVSVMRKAGVADHLTVQTVGEQGNLQVCIKNLGGTLHLDQMIILSKAGHALLQSGLMTDRRRVAQLSHATDEKDSKGNTIWRPFPCLWVNQPDAVAQGMKENTDRVSELEAQNRELSQKIDKLIALQTGKVSQDTKPVETVSVEALTLSDIPDAVVQPEAKKEEGLPIF